MASAKVDNRLQAQMVLLVESHQVIVGLEREAVMTAVHDQIVVLCKGDGGAVCLVKREGIMLAEVFLQERLGDLVGHKCFLLISWCRHCIHTDRAWFH